MPERCEDCGREVASGPVESVPLCVVCRATYEPAALRAWVLWVMRTGAFADLETVR